MNHVVEKVRPFRIWKLFHEHVNNFFEVVNRGFVFKLETGLGTNQHVIMASTATKNKEISAAGKLVPRRGQQDLTMHCKGSRR